MPRFSKSIRVPYGAAECFQLVSEIAKYPDFIRWITAMRVSGRRDVQPGVTECQGEAIVGFKGFTERFTTQVVADEPAKRVTACLVRGPFRKLFAEWRIFETVGGASDITLEIDYEFRNPVIGFLAAANHDLATDRILNAFLAEAQRRFAARAAP
ncbi:type II toxin-antitoxin system RatA family toxin [Hyphomonas sp.]|jgi:coenzyme Q-binding protein COQ10|uniref:type II toxin-antitoxin system RatA family toxin n=1 Tax=Hyphomonas sp. TaxID=87 RepID=UPI0037BF9D24